MSLTPHRRRRSVAIAAAVAAVALVLSACSTTGGAQPSSSTESTKDLSLNMGVYNGSISVPFYTAVERGYFAEEHLDVNATKFDNGPAIGAAMSGGSVDVGLLGGALPLLASRGVGTIFQMALLESNGQRIYSNPSITSVKQLKGQTIQLTKGTTSEIFLYYVLKKAGLTESDVTIVNSDTAGAINAFVAKQAPVIVVAPPDPSVISKQRPDAKLLAQAKDYPEAAVFDGYMVRPSYLAENREAVIRFSRAMNKANDYYIAHRQSAEEAVRATYFPTIDSATFHENLVSFGTNSTAEWVKEFQNGTTGRSLDRILGVYQKLGVVDSVTPSKAYFDPSIQIDSAK